MKPCDPPTPSSHETKPRFGELSRLDAVRRGDARIERLAHRSELRLEARGARRNEAQRVAGLVAREPHHSGGRDGRPEGAGGRGLMEPAIVVPTAQHHADADRGLRPDEERVERG